MNLLYVHDKLCYRRWVNLFPTLLLPGSAQFLSGRRRAGFAWFCSYLLVIAALAVILVHPHTSCSVRSEESRDLAGLAHNVFFLAMACDGFRRPIPRLHAKGWCSLVAVFLCVIVLPLLGLRAFAIQPFKLPGASMAPTLLGKQKDATGNSTDGDYILVNKFIYLHSPPQRGDVVAFKSTGLPICQPNAIYLKRVVGLPGETIGFDPPYLVVNGRRVLEPQIFRLIARKSHGYQGFCPATPTPNHTFPLASSTDTLTLGPDEYFVLGDNTHNSLDSRYFGPVKRAAILGKAFYIYAPADRKRMIQ